MLTLSSILLVPFSTWRNWTHLTTSALKLEPSSLLIVPSDGKSYVPHNISKNSTSFSSPPFPLPPLGNTHKHLAIVILKDQTILCDELMYLFASLRQATKVNRINISEDIVEDFIWEGDKR